MTPRRRRGGAAALRQLHGTSDRGSGTVLALGLVGVIALLVLALAALGGAQEARGRAQSAADLGALAGAGAARWGIDACAVAAEAVASNDAVLISCRVEGGGVIRVEVSSEVAGGVGRALTGGVATASARAGPHDRPAPPVPEE